MGGDVVAAPVYLEDGEPVMLRLSRARRALNLVPLAGVWGWQFFTPDSSGWFKAVAAISYVAILTNLYRSTGCAGVDLRRGFFVVRRGWRSRGFAACDIQDIRVERRGPWSPRDVTIVLADGRRRRLHEAGRGRGLRADFGPDLARIRDWWLANRHLDIVVVDVNRTAAGTAVAAGSLAQ